MELLAEKRVEMRSNFRKRLHTIFKILSERSSFDKSEARECKDESITDEEEIDASTQSYIIQKNELIDLLGRLHRYNNSLPVFGFNSYRYDTNFIESFLIPYVINEKDIEPSIIMKASDFVSFKFRDFRLLDIRKFLSGATTSHSFLKV